MADRDDFVKKALAFVLQCTAIYQGLQPDVAILDVVTADGGKVVKYHYNGSVQPENVTYELSDFGETISNLQVQMMEKDGKLVLAGQVNAGDKCRPFVLEGSELKPRSTFVSCKDRVAYMLNERFYHVKCKTSQEDISTSVVTDLKGNLIAGAAITDQAALPCQSDLAVSQKDKVFAFDKPGCMAVGDDITKWTAAEACKNSTIALTEGTVSDLYSLYYLWLVFKGDCKAEADALSSFKDKFLINTYVKLQANLVETSTAGNATESPENLGLIIGGGVSAVAVLILLVVLVLLYIKGKLCCKRKRLAEARGRNNNKGDESAMSAAGSTSKGVLNGQNTPNDSRQPVGKKNQQTSEQKNPPAAADGAQEEKTATADGEPAQ